MKLRILNVFIILTLLHAPVSLLDSGQKGKLSAAEVLEKVQEAYANVEDGTAGFTQSVSLKYAKIEQTYSGTVMIKKGTNTVSSHRNKLL